MSRIRLNLAAGFANGLWGALLGLAAVPFYIRFLGMEAYGLVGFYVALQGVLGLLDFGLTPTMSREVARSRAANDTASPRNLLYTFAAISWSIAALIALALVALSGPLASDWLQSQALPDDLVRTAVMLIGVAIAARWPLAVYNGALIGAERLGLVSGINMVFVTLTTLGALAVLAFVSNTVTAFFIWQAAVGVVQVVATRAAAWSTLRGSLAARFDAAGLKRIWKFSAGTAIVTVLSVLFVQSDKIVLSRLVNLEALGQYTVAWMVTRTLYLVVSPTFNVIFPRMSFLHSSGDAAGLLNFYRTGTRLLMIVIWSGAVYLAFFGHELVAVWTGDGDLAQRIAPCIAFLALGTALNTAMNFPYALQLAAGALRIPVVITTTLILVFIPLLLVLTLAYGIYGAAASWLILNLLYVPFGTWMTHRVLLVGEGLRWIVADVMLPAAGAILVVGIGAQIVGLLPFGDLARGLLGLVCPAAAILITLLWFRPLLAKLLGRSAAPAL
jgi:O-antigen/teichoic acid export membrane protein